MPVWRAATIAVLFFADKNLADVAMVLVASPTRDGVRPARSIFPCVNSHRAEHLFFALCCSAAIWVVVARPYD